MQFDAYCIQSQSVPWIKQYWRNITSYILYSERSEFNMSEIIYFPHDHCRFTKIFRQLEFSLALSPEVQFSLILNFTISRFSGRNKFFCYLVKWDGGMLRRHTCLGRVLLCSQGRLFSSSSNSVTVIDWR